MGEVVVPSTNLGLVSKASHLVASAYGLRGKRQWTEGEGRTLEEILGVVLEKVEATFKGFEEQRQREAQWAKQREEEARWEAQRQATEAQRKALEENKRKERERLARHEEKLEEVAQARRSNLATAAEQWIEAEGIVAFIQVCEQRWLEAGCGNLTPEQVQWLQWARLEAARKFPSAVGYPDPARDGGFDRAVVPIGGPYPETREFEDEEPEEKPDVPVPEVRTMYVEKPQPFPYWALHRGR